MATVFRKLASDEVFREQYTQAKMFGIEAMVEDIQEIADTGANDWMARNDPDNPGYQYNGEAVARSRLRVDVRKWAASKVLAKKYGDALNLNADVRVSGLAATLKALRDQGDDEDAAAG